MIMHFYSREQFELLAYHHPRGWYFSIIVKSVNLKIIYFRENYKASARNTEVQ